MPCVGSVSVFSVLSSARLFSAIIGSSCYTTYLNNLHLITVLLTYSSSLLSHLYMPLLSGSCKPLHSLVPRFILLLYSRCQGIQSPCTIIHRSDTVYSKRINAEKIPWPLQCTAKHHQHSPIPRRMYLNS